MHQRATGTTRKVVAVVTGVALSFGLGDLALASIADAAAVPYVATDAVNVRSGPGTSYKVIGVPAHGKTISGSSTGNGWARSHSRARPDTCGVTTSRSPRARPGDHE